MLGGGKLLPKMPTDVQPIPPFAKIVSFDLTLDGDDQTLEVNAEIDIDGSSLSYETTINILADDELHDVVGRLSEVVESILFEGVRSKRPLKCDSCLGACCCMYPEVHVRRDDIPGLCMATGLSSEEDLRREGIVVGRGVLGTIGLLGRVKIPDDAPAEVPEGQACIFLAWDKNGVGRCTIYENRPLTCRKYEESVCENHADADRKLYQIRPFKRYKTTERQNRHLPPVDLEALQRLPT